MLVIVDKHRGLTCQTVREMFDYDPADGILIWKQVKATWLKVGMAAGSRRPNKTTPYCMIHIMGHKYVAHRLIWLWMTGEWPREQIDHIDGDKQNNKWCNLRAATASQNTKNARVRKDSTTGCRGVYPNGKKFRALINVDRRRIYLGDFRTVDEAKNAYQSAAKLYHGAFSSYQPERQT